jgi:hypothetical protein
MQDGRLMRLGAGQKGFVGYDWESDLLRETSEEFHAEKSQGFVFQNAHANSIKVYDTKQKGNFFSLFFNSLLRLQ